MNRLETLPNELFDIIIEHLVIKIGSYKAVLLRTVSHAFDEAILDAICVTEVVDIDDPAISCLPYRMSPTFRGKIFTVQSRSVTAASKGYLSVVATVGKALDTIINQEDPQLVKPRHESIAGAVLLNRNPVAAEFEAQNLLCGAVIVGNLSIVKSLLERYDIDVNGWTPYFDSLLTLAAGHGYPAIVQYLLVHGARHDSVASNWHRIQGLVCQEDWNRADEERWCLSLGESFPSALRSAVLAGHDDIVDLLLHPDYRLPITSLEYLRGILAGAKAGRLDFICKLFEVIEKDPSDFKGLGNEMLWEATPYGRENIVLWLLEKI